MKIQFHFIFIISLAISGCSNSGDGDTNPQIQNPPAAVPERFISITGAETTLGIKPDGTLWACGKNVGGEMATGYPPGNSYPPTQIGTDADWKFVTTAANCVLAIKTDGSLWNWGTIPNAFFNNPQITLPVRIGNDNDWKTVSGGMGFWLGIKTDGSLWGWGLGSRIGLGNTTQFELLPVLIDNGNWKEIDGEFVHSLALKANGTMWSMGLNDAGDLGNGTSDTHNYVLTQIGTDTDWKHVSAGGYGSIAIKQNGTLWSWGANHFGELGIGTNDDKYIPTQIGTSSDWTMASMTLGGTVLLKSDGTIWGFGDYIRNFFPGEIYNIPIQLDNNNDWESVSMGSSTVYAKKHNQDFWGIGRSSILGLSRGDSYHNKMTPISWNVTY